MDRAELEMGNTPEVNTEIKKQNKLKKKSKDF